MLLLRARLELLNHSESFWTKQLLELGAFVQDLVYVRFACDAQRYL